MNVAVGRVDGTAAQRPPPSVRAIVVAIWVALGSAAASPDPPCLNDGPHPGRTEQWIAAAIDVLSAAGHPPRRYRLELRMEPAARPDFPELGVERVRSVVFVPRDPTTDYPLRVHPSRPCSLAWVWQPGSFTDWQRAVIDRAQAISAARAAGEVQQVQVIETARSIEILVVTGDGSSERIVFEKS
ncbi:MAG TPA: hypothetical protein VD788_06655, partial [Candidatus Polarisedimenticolaceae bacterium]|nr:hypothetical protein [Candidatus Polarisedimenticolaceae bacterium]